MEWRGNVTASVCRSFNPSSIALVVDVGCVMVGCCRCSGNVVVAMVEVLIVPGRLLGILSFLSLLLGRVDWKARSSLV